MKPLLLCALAALLAVPVQAQIRVGGDLGGTFIDGAFGQAPAGSVGVAGSAFVTAERGILRARLALLDASYHSTSSIALNDDRSIALDEDGFAIVRDGTGSITRLGSTLTVGVAVPVYRGVGIGMEAGVRVYHGSFSAGTAYESDVPWFPVLAPEVFAPGPRGTRLYLRGEVYPPSRSIVTGQERGVTLLRLNGGVSVPLRF